MSSDFLFIALTSSPSHIELRNAARKTFLSPCHSLIEEKNKKESSSSSLISSSSKSLKCSYKFFIDKLKPDLKLLEEEKSHHDLVFRNEAPLMLKYPENLHYGILNPLRELNDSKVWYRMYKIEWKISFMKYIYNKINKIPKYLLFVEDDSFICIHNLLYQLTLINKSKKQISFRTGSYICKSGCSFDDSSTLMTGDIAELFVLNYPINSQFKCSRMYSLEKLKDTEIIDWGRSWRDFQCDWRDVLLRNGLDIIEPDTFCPNYFYPFTKLIGKYLCDRNSLALIYHTTGHEFDAIDRLKEFNSYNQHVCEDFLLLDKVTNNK